MTVEFDRTAESWPQADRTVDIDTARSPGLAQGWLLFAGDGDNGGNTDTTAFVARVLRRASTARTSTERRLQGRLRPDANVTLNTGCSRRAGESCTNKTDGSQAVVWEFATFRIRTASPWTIAARTRRSSWCRAPSSSRAGGVLRASGSTAQRHAWSSTISGAARRCGSVGGGNGGDGALRARLRRRRLCRLRQRGLRLRRPPSRAVTAPVRATFSAATNHYTGNTGNGRRRWRRRATACRAPTACPVAFSGSTVSHAGPRRGWRASTRTRVAPSKLYAPSAGSGGGGAGWMGYGNASYTCVSTLLRRAPAVAAVGRRLRRHHQPGRHPYLRHDQRQRWPWRHRRCGRLLGSTGGGGGGSGGGIRLLTPGDIDVTNGTLNAAGGVGR